MLEGLIARMPAGQQGEPRRLSDEQRIGGNPAGMGGRRQTSPRRAAGSPFLPRLMLPVPKIGRAAVEGSMAAVNTRAARTPRARTDSRDMLVFSATDSQQGKWCVGRRGRHPRVLVTLWSPIDRAAPDCDRFGSQAPVHVSNTVQFLSYFPEGKTSGVQRWHASGRPQLQLQLRSSGEAKRPGAAAGASGGH